MPTYLYHCEVHGEFENEHSINDILTLCPSCQKEEKNTKVKRLIAPNAGFILLGSGWAKDNYG